MTVIRAADFAKQAKQQRQAAVPRTVGQRHDDPDDRAMLAARLKGFKAGYAEGQRALTQAAADVLGGIGGIDGLIERRAVALVEDVIAHILDELPPRELVRSCIRKALASLPDLGPCILQVAPDLAETARSAAAGLPVTVAIDPLLSGSQIVLVSPLGRYHAGPRERLAVLLDALAGALGHA